MGTLETSPLIYEKRDAFATLTLNRPVRLNAVNLPLYEAMLKSLAAAESDGGVRVVLLTGAGRAFCVGADLKAHGSEDPTLAERRSYVRAAQEVNRRLQTLRKPVVAAVNGHAIGAGLELALSSDLMVVANEAKLRFPEVAMGTSVGGGTMYTLPQRVGMAKAKELLLLCEFFTGEEAAGMGLAYRSVPGTSVLESALELADRLAARAPISVRWAKLLLNQAMQSDRNAVLRLEARALLACMATDDWREGLRAFDERREPRFAGR